MSRYTLSTHNSQEIKSTKSTSTVLHAPQHNWKSIMHILCHHMHRVKTCTITVSFNHLCGAWCQTIATAQRRRFGSRHGWILGLKHGRYVKTMCFFNRPGDEPMFHKADWGYSKITMNWVLKTSFPKTSKSEVDFARSWGSIHRQGQKVDDGRKLPQFPGSRKQGKWTRGLELLCEGLPKKM